MSESKDQAFETLLNAVVDAGRRLAEADGPDKESAERVWREAFERATVYAQRSKP